MRAILVACALLSLSCGIYAGYSTAVIAGAKEGMGKELGFTEEDVGITGILVSSILVGAFFASMVCGPPTDKYGRRPVSLVAAVVATVATFGTFLTPASWGVWAVIVARFVQGTALGVFTFAVPVYVSECSPPRLRGVMGTCFQLSLTFGIFLAYVANVTLKEHWRWQMALCTVPCVAMFCILLFASETPRWLVAQQREEEARPLLESIMGLAHADAEMDAIAEQVALARQRPARGFGVLFTKRLRKPLLIGIVLCFAQQATGINAVIFYAPDIIADAGFFDSENPRVDDYILLLIGLWNFLTTVFALKLVSKFGRRPLMLVSVTVMSLALSVLAASFFLTDDKGIIKVGWLAPVSLGALFVYIGFFEFGPGPLFFLMLSELFPVDVRAVASSLTTAVQWVVNITVSATFPLLSKRLGPEWAFAFYGGVGVIVVLLLASVLVETKDKTLEQIQDELAGRTAPPPPDAFSSYQALDDDAAITVNDQRLYVDSDLARPYESTRDEIY
ncbi:MAG: hypothetical protein MHM6MM_000804 [Cercozoa sp. M6MM]